MKLATAQIIAESIRQEDISKDNIIPDSLDTDIPIRISKRLEQFRT
jgi:hypothetical protein